MKTHSRSHTRNHPGYSAQAFAEAERDNIPPYYSSVRHIHSAAKGDCIPLDHRVGSHVDSSPKHYRIPANLSFYLQAPAEYHHIMQNLATDGRRTAEHGKFVHRLPRFDLHRAAEGNMVATGRLPSHWCRIAR